MESDESVLTAPVLFAPGVTTLTSASTPATALEKFVPASDAFSWLSSALVSTVGAVMLAMVWLPTCCVSSNEAEPVCRVRRRAPATTTSHPGAPPHIPSRSASAICAALIPSGSAASSVTLDCRLTSTAAPSAAPALAACVSCSITCAELSAAVAGSETSNSTPAVTLTDSGDAGGGAGGVDGCVEPSSGGGVGEGVRGRSGK